MSPFKYRELGRLMKERRGHELTLAVPLPTSPKGMNNLRCPSEVCQPRVFQLGEGSPASGESDPRSRRAPGQPLATCPYCGHDDDQEAFFHPDDIEAIKEQVLWAASRDVGHALQDMASGFNRRSRNRFFSLTMEVKGLNTPRPVFQREDLLRDLTCDVCQRSYGVYAIGLFCPDCGAANLHVHFARESSLVAQQIEIAQAIESELGSELAYRILGNAHEDVVTALETYLKTAYRFLVRKRHSTPEALQFCSKKAIQNSFQNIERGQRLFRQRLNIDPFGHLEPPALERLHVNLEKRHLIGHNLGLVDDIYAQSVGAEAIGSNVPLVAEEVTAFAEVASSVVACLETQPEFQPASAC
jgi:hypothetical protein